MMNLKQIADSADMIINGYAFTKSVSGIRVVNLDHLNKSAMLSRDGQVNETNMDDIELSIVQKYYAQNAKYMEVC